METAGLAKDELAALYKMSKSDPSSTIFLHEAPETIRKKIRKTYCPMGETENNPILEINKYILFAQPGFKLIVERPEKYGGTVVYETYEELEKDFAEKKLHPADLKNATANALIEFLKPVREKLLSDNTVREYIELIMKNITR
jgi:tyrosyl-tRNA synthetase